MSPKIGRPKAKNPKNFDLRVRVDERTNERLHAYAKKKGITRAEVIRRGLIRLLDADEKSTRSPKRHKE